MGLTVRSLLLPLAAPMGNAQCREGEATSHNKRRECDQAPPWGFCASAEEFRALNGGGRQREANDGC